MIDLDKLSKPWKKALLGLPLEHSIAGNPAMPKIPPLPDGVEVVQVVLKLYGEGLPEEFRTKEGECIQHVTLDEMAAWAAGSST